MTLISLRTTTMGATLMIGLLAASCGTTASTSGGTGDSTAGSDTPSGSDGAATDLASGTPLFVDLQTTIFSPKCSTAGCHDASGAKFSGKLQLDTAAIAYKSLVTNGTIDSCSKAKYVTPGDHANSGLWARVTPDGAKECTKMPADVDPAVGLSQAEADLIAAWIDAGAKGP